MRARRSRGALIAIVLLALLAAVGADMSRAGEGAAAMAIQVAALKPKYAGRALTTDDLQLASGCQPSLVCSVPWVRPFCNALRHRGAG